MFPLGNLLKCDVKRLAAQAGLEPIAKKRESVGICFVGKRNLYDFISEYVERNPGEFVHRDSGRVWGQHDGIHYWTVGQRARIAGSKDKLYILRKQPDRRTILLCGGGNHPGLYTNLLYTDRPHWIANDPFESTSIFRCKFRFQHLDELIDCIVCQQPTTSGLFIKLDLPLRALTPGQYAVFYRDDECLGGARITDAGPSLEYGTEDEQRLIGDTYKQHYQIQKITKSKLDDENIKKMSTGVS